MDLRHRSMMASPNIKEAKDEGARNVFTQLLKQLNDMFKNVYDDLITISSGAFASIHAADNSDDQTIPTGVTYTKITAFDSNGDYREITPDQANDKITINDVGYYFISGCFNFQCDKANTIWRGAVFLDGAEKHELHFKHKLQTAGDVACASVSGILKVEAVDLDLDFRVRHSDGGNVDVLFEYLNLSAHFIGRL